MKILFVCTGNTCRSPMAEAIMREKCKERKLDIECTSAGLCAFCGDPASPQAVAVMKERGIDIASHRAKTLTAYHMQEYDIIVCMTKAHCEHLSAFGEKVTAFDEDIPDPYGGSIETYRLCADKISEEIDILIDRLTLSVRPMEEKDIAAIAKIEEESFSSPWSEKGIRAELTNDSAHFFVCEKYGKVIGYGGMHITIDEGYIANIAVSADSRKCGIGSAILSALVSTAEQKGCGFLSLEVRKSNLPAVSLYEKFGFVNVGERKNFYTSPTENAIIMTKYFGKEV